MCFTVPLKVIKTANGSAVVEGGRTVKLGPDMQTKAGDYLQILGGIAVGCLTAGQGKKIRSAIAQLNRNYETE